MKLRLFLPVLFFCTIAKAQTNSESKDFINRNNEAITLIHQEIVKYNDLIPNDVFKLLLQKQLACVKLYKEGNNNAISYAFDLRNNCINVIKNYIKKSDLPFQITASEKNYIVSDLKFDSNLLEDETLKSIKELYIFDKNDLNKYTLSIQ